MRTQVVYTRRSFPPAERLGARLRSAGATLYHAIHWVVTSRSPRRHDGVTVTALRAHPPKSGDSLARRPRACYADTITSPVGKMASEMRRFCSNGLASTARCTVKSWSVSATMLARCRPATTRGVANFSAHTYWHSMQDMQFCAKGFAL